MTILILITASALCSFQSLFCKLFSQKYEGSTKHASLIYSAVLGIIITTVSIIISGFRLNISPITLLFGCINAAVLTAYNIILIRASILGPLPVIVIFSMFGGIIIPLLTSVFAFSDSFSALQISAIVIMLVSFVLICFDKKQAGSTNPIFYLLCILLFIGNGIYSSLLDVQQRLCNGGEREMMLAVTYAGSGIAVAVRLLQLKHGVVKITAPSFKNVIYLLICCMSAAMGANLLTYLLTLMNAVLVYTIVNGIMLILSIIYSYGVFKEKLATATIAGTVIAVAGIIMLTYA